MSGLLHRHRRPERPASTAGLQLCHTPYPAIFDHWRYSNASLLRAVQSRLDGVELHPIIPLQPYFATFFLACMF